jgi:hypothetical protein
MAVDAVERVSCAQAGDLCHAPELDERHTKALLDLLHLGHRHGLAAYRAARE